MLHKLPYRLQVPLGLALAVLITAFLVMVVSAQISVHSAKRATLATVNRAVVLLVAQSRPLISADDTWRIYTLLRDTAALLPGVDAGHSRLAVLDQSYRVMASSHPAQLETGRKVAEGDRVPGDEASTPMLGAGTLQWVVPVRSDDGQVLGHLWVEIDGAAFEPVWLAVAQPALLGGALAVFLLLPAGWWVGQRMALPVARIADCIGKIGHSREPLLCEQLPRTEAPELWRIGDAVRRLIAETEQRRKAEDRALSAERLAAVGRLTAAVAHEINNPLAGLLTTTQTMRLHGEDGFQRLKSLDLMERGLRQIQTTVAALLPQARLADRVLTCTDLDDVVSLAQGTARSLNVHCEAKCRCLGPLHVPSAAIRQVMLNLLLNAIKAAGPDGWVRAALCAGGDRFSFHIANSGSLLTPQRLEELIESESGPDPRGFGLWVCRQLAIQAGGGFGTADTSPCGQDDPWGAEPMPRTDFTHLVFWVHNKEEWA